MNETRIISGRTELCKSIHQVFQFWRDAHDRKEQGDAGALVETKLWGQIHAVCAEAFLHGADAEIKAITEFLSRLDLRREAPRGPRPSGQEPDGCPASEQGEAQQT
jgi:hypothetical protein